ncbi:sugar nucleotide-binding protein [Pseudaeromonas paramecii]|uniref:dTDP-4-dehydrorhamnose reductase n=1 Tax=Pseudaeromonas paramecii TaxID=2138166 RepID=A0ABP8PXH4_9GAMM
MRVLISGLNGTLAPHLARRVVAEGGQVLPWRRELVDPTDETAGRQMLDRLRPDAIAHLAMGSEAWAAFLAREARVRQIPLLFTSTAMVFDAVPDGPHQRQDTPNAQDDYGRYKIRCEQGIQATNPAACIARIGWQIDAEARGNNMLAALDEWQASRGEVAASRLWIPACSFMADTAAGLWQLLQARAQGIHHLDSNAVCAWGFDTLVQALAQHFARSWQIRVTDEYRHDQRLLGSEAWLPPLSARLAAR